MNSMKEYKRRLLPRWHSTYTLAESKFFGDKNRKQGGKKENSEHSLLEINWRKEGSLISAVELTSAALMAENWSNKLAISAAKHIEISNLSSVHMREIASSFLHGEIACMPGFGDSDEAAYKKIRELKSRLRINIFDAFAWLDMGFFYAFCGQEDKSLGALRVASELSKSSFVARSYARALMHYGHPDKAIQLLRRLYVETGDYHFAASEMAICDHIGISSKCGDRVVRKFNNEMIKGRAKEEVGAIIATMDCVNGAHKKAKNLIGKISKFVTNENVMAQVEWVARQSNCTIVDRPDIPADYEADALAAYRQSNLKETVRHCLSWVRYQPFSSAPAVRGSYIASVGLGDFNMAETLSSYAYRYSDDDFMSFNNYAFSLAANGKIEKARKVLSAVSTSRLSESERSTYLATTGYLYYKEGRLLEGWDHYSRAIKGFKEEKDVKSIAIASHFWCSVDKKINTPELRREISHIAWQQNIKELKDLYPGKLKI